MKDYYKTLAERTTVRVVVIGNVLPCRIWYSYTQPFIHFLTNKNRAIAPRYKKCLHKHALALAGIISWSKHTDPKSGVCFSVWGGAGYLAVFTFTLFYSHAVFLSWIGQDVFIPHPLCFFIQPYLHGCRGDWKCHGLEKGKRSNTAQAKGHPKEGWSHCLLALHFQPTNTRVGGKGWYLCAWAHMTTKRARSQMGKGNVHIISNNNQASICFSLWLGCLCWRDWMKPNVCVECVCICEHGSVVWERGGYPGDQVLSFLAELQIQLSFVWHMDFGMCSHRKQE